jgi:hypothetical protein
MDTASVSAALMLCTRVARERVETCATLMRNAEAALHDNQEQLAVDAIFDVEPILFDVQTILNAGTMLRRIVREQQHASP